MIRPIFALCGLSLCAVVGLRALGYGASAPLPPAEQPLEACSRVLRGMASLDMAPAWDSLPVAWQDDLDGLVDKLEQSAQPELWARSFSLMERLDALLRAQCHAYMDGMRRRTAAVLTTITSSPLDDPDNLAHLDLRELAQGFLLSVEEEFQAIDGHLDEPLFEAAFTKNLVSQASQLDAHTGSQVPYIDGLESIDIQSSRTTDQGPAWTHQVFFTRHGDRWCDASLVSQWDGLIGNANARIEAWTQNTESGELDFALDLLAALEGGLTDLEAAATPAAFDSALDLTTGKVGAIVMREKFRAMLK
ncbi:MAG: hypothetical protein ACJAVJ_001450 [Planctomycetota bacterium]|jgi:hypothetical protein